MGFCESKWLNKYNFNKPNFYLKYVDDILAAFDNEQDSLNCADFLIKRHPHYNTTCITPFYLSYYIQYLCANYRHFLLSWLHFANNSSYYNTPCNRFCNNYVINKCPRHLL